MLSIVTDPLQSSINKHQIMSILSNNYHAIFISIFTASVVILSIYWTSKYYQQTDLTVDDSNSTNDDTNCNQKHKQKKDIQLNRTPVNITLLHEQHQHKHKHTQLVPSPNPNPSSIPDQLKFSHSKPQNTSFKSVNIQQPKPSQPSAFTPFDDPPVFPHSNNNGFTTIRRRKTEQTIIKYPNQEPITIKKTTTEHIDIPHVALWSPFVHGLRYAVAEDQGTRQHMENRTNIVDMNPNSQNDKTYSFSLFDGHLGDEAATFCTDHLHEHVQSCIHDSNEDDIISSIRQAFHHTDDAFKKYALDHECEAGAVGVYVYYQCNANNSDLDCIYVANVGDCRAILCSKGTLSILTTDHNPKNEDEKKRCGDRIDCNSDLLSGQISVTRAIGDYYKVQTDDDDDDDDDAFESESDVYDSDDPDSYKKKQPRKRKEYKKKRMQEMAKAEERFKYFVADGYVAYSVLLLQIFPYYFQGYAELLQSEGSREYLSPIINLFNFNFVNNKVGSNEGFCFIPKQTALDEISVILLFPGLMWLSLLLLYMFCNKGTFCVQIQLKCCGLSTVVCNRPYIPIAFTRISMLVLGLVFRVLLQLVTCVKFDDALDQVPFYYGGYCHQAPWFLGFASMIIFLLFILSVYKKLASQGHDERFSQTNTYSKLVQAYKANYWYWEAIVTLRRFLLTMFMSLSFLGGGYTNLILCVVLLIFLFAQIGLNPYAHKRNNRVETFCLLSLLIGVIALNFDDIEDSLFVSFFLAVVVFVPVVLALLFSVQLGRRVGKYFHGDEQYYLDNHATEDDDEDDRKQPGGHRPAVSSEYKTEKMMQRVLKKVTTEKWLGSREPQSPEIDVMKTAPHQHSTDKGEYGRVMKNTETTGRGYGATQKSAEMATLAAPEDSDSSCGLSEN
eukprot:1072532_1